MTDYTELKRLAEAATAGPWSMCGEADGSQGFEIIQDIWNEHGTHTGKDVVVYEWSDESDPLGVIHRADAEFIAAANPVAVLALIADLDEARNGMKHSCAIRLKKEIERLKAELDCPFRLARHSKRLVEQLRAQAEQYDQALIKMAAERDQLRAELATERQRRWDGNESAALERDEDVRKLRAEIAGLKTGYEAYERVNAELKAENDALRDDLEQIKYDANAWRNGEESVWIEVFNSEGDDPFISAISGQITVEQLALIQAEILEYREDYFEKGSGLYVFRCGHCQAHYDNVGMTEPAHWETDFESYSPFPWEEEAAALGQGEQS